MSVACASKDDCMMSSGGSGASLSAERNGSCEPTIAKQRDDSLSPIGKRHRSSRRFRSSIASGSRPQSPTRNDDFISDNPTIPPTTNPRNTDSPTIDNRSPSPSLKKDKNREPQSPRDQESKHHHRRSKRSRSSRHRSPSNSRNKINSHKSEAHKSDAHKSESRNYPRSRSRDHESRRHKRRPSSRSPAATRKHSSGSEGGRGSSRRAWRFDSPPRDSNATSNSKTSNFSSVPPTGGPAANVTTETHIPIFQGEVGKGMTTTEIARNTQLAQIAQQLGLSAEGAKAARELYIGNLPPGVDVNQLVEFLNAAILAMGLNILPGSPVVKSWISTDGHFAFVEFRTMEEATAGMKMNGLNCLGYNLRIGRPKTYPAELAALTAQIDAANGSYHNDLINGKLGTQDGMGPGAACERYVMFGIPSTLTQSRVRELLSTFGSLRTCDYIASNDNTENTNRVNASKVDGDGNVKKDGGLTANNFDRNDNLCIVEYDESKSLKLAIQSLEGLRVCGSTLQLLDATTALAAGKLSDYLRDGSDAAVAIGGELMRVQVPTKVILLSNLVVADELVDDNEYYDILLDVESECGSYGQVSSVHIPRPVKGIMEVDSSVGYAFVEFDSIDSAIKARKALSGRKFADRTVEAHYFSERKYVSKEFKNPRPNYSQGELMTDSTTA